MVEKKGFVLFFDSNYLPYGLNLIDSLLSFSKYDIEVNCINFNYDFNLCMLHKPINNINFFIFDKIILVTVWCRM